MNIPHDKFLENVVHALSQAGGRSGSVDLCCVETTASTMDLAKKLSQERKKQSIDEDGLALPPLIVLAREQTAGRGRGERSWESVRDKGIFVTFVLCLEKPVAKLMGYSLALGVAVKRTLELAGCSAQLKWPNDVLVACHSTNKLGKVAGILTEVHPYADGGSCVSAGIGLNLFPSRQVLEVDGISLVEALGKREKDIDYFSMFSRLSEQVLGASADYLRDGFQGIIAEWEESSFLKGRSVSMKSAGKTELVRVHGVDSRGGLVVSNNEDEAARRVVYSGEVEIVDAISN